MPRLKKTVAVLTTNQGHASIAAAVSQSLTRSYRLVTYVDQVDLAGAYQFLYRYLPQAWGPPFRLSSQMIERYQRAYALGQKFSQLRNVNKLQQFDRQHQPDVFITTHYMYFSSINQLKRRGQKVFINVVSDPRSIHRLLIADGAEVNLVFDKTAQKVVKRMAPKVNAIPTGWFVRQEFEQSYNQIQVRKQLKLKNRLTILIASGSDGTNLILKLLPALPLAKTPVQIVVACGHNKHLFRLVNKLGQLIKRYNSNVQLQPLSFTNQIHLWMQAADLVIGKAGPNMLFESVATLTPFFAITHISGQETGNLEIIRQHRLGYVEENLVKASRLLLNIINQPQQLEQFQPSLKKMAQFNQQSKKKLLELVNELVSA